MLPTGFILIAILLRFVAGASYMRAVWRGKAKPSLVSWAFWSLTAGIAFLIQLSKGAGPEAFVTLAIGLSPLAVCIVALYKRAYMAEMQRSDWWCIALALMGIMLWLISKDPLVALCMSILTDIFTNVPTVLKAYRAPHTEHATAYLISIASMAITLLTISNWRITVWLFPAYILFINLVNALTIKVFSRWRGVMSFRLSPGILAYHKVTIDD